MAKDMAFGQAEGGGGVQMPNTAERALHSHLILVLARHVQDPCSVLVCEGQVEGDNALLCVEIHP
jgi:hypothetical protein